MKRTFQDEAGKAWQLEAKDSALVITQGKVGKAGRMQSKPTRSALEALQKLDDLALEHIREGHVEVNPPSPFEHLRARAMAVAPAVDVWLTTKTGLDLRIDHGNEAPAAPRADEIVREVMRVFTSETPPAKPDAKTEGAAYRLLARVSERGTHLGERFAERWVATGPSFAVSALLASTNLRHVHEGAASITALGLLDSPADDDTRRGAADGVWRPIRRALASAPDETHQAAHGEVAKAREKLALNVRAVVDAATGDQAWCLADATAFIATKDKYMPLALWSVLFSIKDPAAVVHLLGELPTPWTLLEGNAENVAEDLVETMGESAIEPLAHMLSLSYEHKGYCGGGFVRALARIPSERAAEVLVRALDFKDLRDEAAKFFVANRDVSIAALKKHAAGSTTGAVVASGLAR